MNDVRELEADVFGERDLLERLGRGVARSGKEVVFVVGSGLAAPRCQGEPGVPTVAGMIELIESEFDAEQVTELHEQLAGAANPYQAAFRFVQSRRGQSTINDIIRRAVIRARRLPADGTTSNYSISNSTPESLCVQFDEDVSGWHLTPGMVSLGQLASGWPERFGGTVLTTNFDPLIQVAIRTLGGASYRTVLHRDGNLFQTTGSGTHIVHLHGYWYGADTLHTPRQLGQERPQLRASLSSIMRGRTLVVLAYGGWDDVFTKTLLELVADDNAFQEVIWTFRDPSPRVRPMLQAMFNPGIDRGNVTFYAGIDGHAFLPRLAEAWRAIEPPVREIAVAGELNSQSTRLATAVAMPVPLMLAKAPDDFGVAREEREPTTREQERRLNALVVDEGRPPEVPVYVGREDSLRTLRETKFKAAFITGVAGQGKSALAGVYFESDETLAAFDHRIWRDCREQSFRFEDYLLSIVLALVAEQVTAGELAKLSIEDLTRLFARLTRDLRLLMVFDNVDHHVDLERRVLIGAPGRFLDTFLSLKSSAQVIFTCRPGVKVEREDTISIGLDGLGLAETLDLFTRRGANLDEVIVRRAHAATRGQALWLDVIAAQAASSTAPLKLDRLEAASATAPDEIANLMLRPIWQNLEDRPKIVLQVLAETVKPTSVLELSDYLGSQLRYAKATRAIEILKARNLIVVRRQDAGETYELHPLVREFVRRTHKVHERVTIIDMILAAQRAMFDMYRPQLASKPTAEAVRTWLQAAELNLNADRIGPALDALNKVSAAASSEAPADFVRVASLALAREDLHELTPLPGFDDVFTEYIHMLVTLGRTDAATAALDVYEATLEGKEARYINLCDMRCYLHWVNHSFPAAIQWGSRGVDLKRESSVDTGFDCSHNLALAQRDAGFVEPALEYFLNGEQLDNVVQPDVILPDRGETFYGNVGRCLHLMGQIEPALECYRKAARLLLKDSGGYSTENQGFAFQWIGELLGARKDPQAGINFLIAARAKWEMVSPPRADRVTREIEQLTAKHGIIRAMPSEALAFATEWLKH